MGGPSGHREGCTQPLPTGDQPGSHVELVLDLLAQPVEPGPGLGHPSVDLFNNRRTDRLERDVRSEEHTSELQSRGHLVCRLLLEKKKHIESAIHMKMTIHR